MTKLLLMTVALAVSCFGQQAKAEEDLNRSYGQLNGRGWLEMPGAQRLGYLQGVMDGVQSPTNFPAPLAPEGVSRADYRRQLADIEKFVTDHLKAMTPGNLTFSETRTALDQFFQDPVNRDLPVTWALRIIKDRTEGTAPDAVEQELASFRKFLTLTRRGNGQ